jgi:hypothetical protein
VAPFQFDSMAEPLSQVKHDSPFNRVSNAILLTTAYADVFDYPLTAEEIHRYLIGIQLTLPAVERALQEVLFLNHVEGYYAFRGREMIAHTRRRRQRFARRLWSPAIRYGQKLANLPFVRMVAVTGALAMDNVEEGADIDYLVVTEQGRLWMCRALVLLIGRLAKLAHGVTLCPNYMISLDTLEFPDRTLYTAHEIAQMVPLSGMAVYDQIRRQNAWVGRLLPNADSAPATSGAVSNPTRPSIVSPALEAVLQSPLFTFLELWEMDRKIRKLRGEQGASPEATFSADFCKGHADQHQAHTRLALEERLIRLQGEYLI